MLWLEDDPPRMAAKVQPNEPKSPSIDGELEEPDLEVPKVDKDVPQAEVEHSARYCTQIAHALLVLPRTHSGPYTFAQHDPRRSEPQSEQAPKTSTQSRLSEKVRCSTVHTLPICTVSDSSCKMSFDSNYASHMCKVAVVFDTKGEPKLRRRIGSASGIAIRTFSFLSRTSHIVCLSILLFTPLGTCF